MIILILNEQTMKNLNLLCSLLMLSVAFIFGLNIFVGADSFVSGFATGWSQAEAEVDEQDQDFSYCEIVPRENTYRFKTVNEKTGAPLAFDPKSMIYKSKEVSGPTINSLETANTVTAFLILGLYIYLWIVFLGLVRRINRGEIFTLFTERRFRRMGIIMLSTYVAEWFFAIFQYQYVSNIVEIKGFDVVMGDIPSGYSLITGIFLFIVAQIFTVAREMKEEQELTI